jgi:NADH-ubiquinone oxidoreductase chain 2
MIPPFIGFFGKQSVIYSSIDSGFFFMTLIAILVSVISASYYLKLIKEAYSPQTSSSAYNKISKDNKDLISSTALNQKQNKNKDFSGISSLKNLSDFFFKIENNYGLPTIPKGVDSAALLTLQPVPVLFGISPIPKGLQSKEMGVLELKVLNLSNVHAFIISFITLSIILFFLNPSILMNSASLITLNYFYL